eukprot:4999365-Alexandrium_andersonii.AAC.1
MVEGVAVCVGGVRLGDHAVARVEMHRERAHTPRVRMGALVQTQARGHARTSPFKLAQTQAPIYSDMPAGNRTRKHTWTRQRFHTRACAR